MNGFEIGDAINVKAIVAFEYGPNYVNGFGEFRENPKRPVKSMPGSPLGWYVGFTRKAVGAGRMFEGSGENYLKVEGWVTVARVRFLERGAEYLALFEDIEKQEE